ncbi:MAG: glycosyltransferase family 4 protein [Conexivisphaerales archaeon]
MKVILVGPNKPIGGISSHVRSLASGLARLGNEVHILPKIDADNPSTFLYFLRRLISNQDITHIHGLQSFNPIIVSLLAKVMTSTRTVVTVHGFGGESGWWSVAPEREAMKQLVSRMDLCITISKYVEERFRRFTGNRARIVTVYCGVDTSFFSPSVDGNIIRRKLGLEQKFVVLFVGRLAWNKGLFDLIEAIGRAKHRAKAVHLIICGKGKLGDAIRRRVNELDLEKYVSMVGLVKEEELPSYYASSDVVCFPSTFEPFGLVPLEAMSMAKPVVACRVGGIPESIVHYKTGILVPPHSPDDIADALVELAFNPSLRKEMGVEGRNIVKEKFSVETMSKSIHDYYCKLE